MTNELNKLKGVRAIVKKKKTGHGPNIYPLSTSDMEIIFVGSVVCRSVCLFAILLL